MILSSAMERLLQALRGRQDAIGRRRANLRNGTSQELKKSVGWTERRPSDFCLKSWFRKGNDERKRQIFKFIASIWNITFL
jgi:hypothetical protein